MNEFWQFVDLVHKSIEPMPQELRGVIALALIIGCIGVVLLRNRKSE